MRSRVVLLFLAGCLFGQKPVPGPSAVGSGGGGSSSSTGLVASASSSTVLAITAGACQNDSVTFTKAASTGTLGGTSATSTIFGYCSDTGDLVLGHNGAATLTPTGSATVATSITVIPPGSLPLFSVPYTANVLGAVTSLISTARGNPVLCGTGMSCGYDGSGRLTVTNTGSAAVSPGFYLPWGILPSGGGNATTVFTANQTRWQRAFFPYPMTFTGMKIVLSADIGASKGIKMAVADTSGTILYTTATGTAAATSAVQTLAFSSPITLTAGSYYLGITTDSTTMTSEQVGGSFFGAEKTEVCNQTEANLSPAFAGTGTVGSGTVGSVAFGASMGTLTQYSCDSGSNLLQSYFMRMYLY